MDNAQSPQSIDFNSIKTLFGLKNRNNLIEYLSNVYPDLCEKNSDDAILGVPFIKFIDLLKLPRFICEKFFYSINKHKSEYISNDQLTQILCLLYYGTFKETAKVIFDIYDFNHDELINKEDVISILSFLPLKEDRGRTSYNYQLKSLEELNIILNKTFKKNTFLNFEEFCIAVTDLSDIYLTLLCYFFQKCLFKEENLKIASTSLRRSLNSSSNSSNKDNPSDNSSVDLNNSGMSCQIEKFSSKKFALKNSLFMPKQRFVSEKNVCRSRKLFLSLPAEKAIFSSVNNFLLHGLSTKLKQVKKKKRSQIKYKTTNDKKYTSYLTSAMDGVVCLSHRQSQRRNSDRPKENMKFCRLKKFLHGTTKEIVNDQYIHNLITTSFNETEDKEEPKDRIQIVEFPNDDEQLETDDDEELTEHEIKKRTLIEGSVCKWSTKQMTLKPCWMVLVGYDLYYYQNESKTELLKINNILGCFIRGIDEETYKSEKYSSFQIIFRNKIKRYLVKHNQDALKWVQTLREALGYKDMFDYYEMIDDIGKGSYGEIKLGVNLKTNQKVAVKIFSKHKLKNDDLKLVDTEIDVLKFCKHPNIINFLDHFENSEYIFLVLEYIKHGDLNSYLSNLEELIPEEDAALIIYQIAEALNYLQKFGIVHRDLKMENIMISKIKNNKIKEIKILDFGLSKIFGQTETSGERFGTLYYISPEIVSGKSHDKSTDIWSLGVIIYHLLSGLFPFDSENRNKKEVTRKIACKELDFPGEIWKHRSPESVELIIRCLVKDMNKRIKIDQIINSSWLKRFIHRNDENKNEK